MSFKSKTGSSEGVNENTIPFGKKYTESEQFSVVFQEGMALVEATAAYLDGDGRADAKGLETQVSLAYATESMRLTTRLMQLASWLLIRRAVNDGEMTPEQAFEEQNKIKFQHITSNVCEEAYAALPVQLRELNEASLNLHRRIVAIDRLLKAELDDTSGKAPKAIDDQMSRLAEAFGPMVEKPPNEEPSGEPA